MTTEQLVNVIVLLSGSAAGASAVAGLFQRRRIRAEADGASAGATKVITDAAAGVTELYRKAADEVRAEQTETKRELAETKQELAAVRVELAHVRERLAHVTEEQEEDRAQIEADGVELAQARVWKKTVMGLFEAHSEWDMVLLRRLEDRLGPGADVPPPPPLIPPDPDPPRDHGEGTTPLRGRSS